jgi:putative ABC transport system permease protein
MADDRKHNLSKLSRVVTLGVKSLMLHRLRSLLTTLGMVFGVCSVIAMLAIGEGANFEAQEQIKGLGSQNIILKSIKPAEEKGRARSGGSRIVSYGLTYEDVRAIHETVPGVSVIVPDRKRRDYVYQTRHRTEAEIVGTVPWYPSLRNRTVEQGRFINDTDVTQQAKVCVLERELVPSLFPISQSLGKTVRVGRHYFEVVGLLEPRRARGEADAGQAGGTEAVPNRLFIPLTTARALFGEMSVQRHGRTFQAEEVQLHEVTVQVEKLEDVEGASLVIRNLLARAHARKDFDVIVPMELLHQAERTKRIFNTVLGSIAAISLLVGGIGIMNIMLASVSERTREIGIRRALGARKRDIISQFLVETAMLASTGGLLGVALGIVIPTIVGMLTDMVTIVTWWSLVVAFGISSLTGVVFGLYPAYQAAQMHPVEALRHE